MSEVDFTRVDLERMAVELEVGMGDLKIALGLPLAVTCTAETIEKAVEEFDNSESGSEEELAAHVRWRELCAAAIEAASDLEGARKALYRTPAHTPEKEAGFLKYLGYCTTLEEVNEVTPPPNLRDAAARRKAELYTNFKELLSMFERAGEDSVREEILIRLIGMVQTEEEGRRLRNHAFGEEGAAWTAYLRKMAAFFLKEVQV